MNPALVKLFESENFESYVWKTRLDTTKFIPQIPLERVEVRNHPLECLPSQAKDDIECNSEKKPATSPLEKMFDGEDPLGIFRKRAQRNDSLGDDDHEKSVNVSSMSRSAETGFFREPWNVKKDFIMTECCNFDLDIDLKRLQVEVSDQLALDEEFLTAIRNLKPPELVNKLESFRKDIVRAWRDEQRVDTLKIVLLCVKLLTDTENPASYPLKYVCITDTLNTFGNLVYVRLKNKCQQTWYHEPSSSTASPKKLSPEIVSDSAKETCLNWFCKIASIRELVPRLYAEAALLQSYSFLRNEIHPELEKLTKLARGVGDPLVNLYLRCYFCRVGLECNIRPLNLFHDNFDEFMIIFSAFLSQQSAVDKATLHRYLEIFSPGLEWIMKGVIDCQNSSQRMMFEKFRTIPNYSILLLAILNCFKEEFIFDHIMEIISWLKRRELVEIPKYKYLKILGKLYEKHIKTATNFVPVEVLNTIWDESQLLSNTTEYLNIIDLWLPLSVNHLAAVRVNLLLKTLGPHIARDHFVEKFSTRLENIMRNLSRYVDTFSIFLISEYFLPFLNTIPKGELRVTICKIVIDGLVKRSHESFIFDSVTLNSLMFVAKTLHDSINALTVIDERKQIGNLLAKFVMMVNFKDYPEKYLDFYVEARGAFFELEPVIVTLIHCANRLAFDRLKAVKGHHSTTSLNFAQSCVAYSFITIPSVKLSIKRLQLLIISCQVALANKCVDVGSACFTEALHVIRTFPESESTLNSDAVEGVLKSYTAELLSILLVIPDNPDGKNVFRLYPRLIQALREHSWKDPTWLPSISILIIRIYSAGYQEKYPYRFVNVDSNNMLYGPDALFREQIDNVVTILLRDVLKMISRLGKSGKPKLQTSIALDLLMCVLAKGDITNKSLAVLSVQIWCACSEKSPTNKKLLESWVLYCIEASPPGSIYENILKKIHTNLHLNDK